MDFLDDAWVLRISDDIRHCYWNAVRVMDVGMHGRFL